MGAKRRATWFAWGAGLLALLALVAFVYAQGESKRAKTEQAKAEQQKIIADSNALVAIDREKYAETQRVIADSNAQIAKEKTQIAEQALAEADANLKRAKIEEARTKAALEQVNREKAATEAERQRAEENYSIAQQKTKEAEAEAENARQALEAQQKALANVVRLTLKDADALIHRLDYEAALEKIKSTIPIGAAKKEISDALLELAFWYTETNRLDRAWGVLDTAYSLAGRTPSPSGEGWGGVGQEEARAAISTLNPARERFLQARYYPVMLNIPGETDTLGSGEPDEKLFIVTLSPFQLAETETTWWQYNLYCAATGAEVPDKPVGWGGEGDNPVINVEWYDAVRYANWVSDQKGLQKAISGDSDAGYAVQLQAPGFRLPTEAEWEYAARAGENFLYVGSNEPGMVAWFDANSGSRTRPVKGKAPNGWGLYDMSGNVWEWCWDRSGDFPDQLGIDYPGPVTGYFRVLCGGSWYSDADYCRLTARNRNEPFLRSFNLGFRVARHSK